MTISDSTNTPSFPFVITVTNLAPTVTTTIPTDITAVFGTDYIYTLPTSMDPEGLPFTTKIVNGPSFAAVLSNT